MPEHPVHAIDLAVPVGPTDHTLGPEHAPVVVVEYGDFQCPTCKQAAPTVRLLLERFANRVHFAFRHFPLEQAHASAMAAAEAAESAGEQGKFWEMHDLLFANQEHLSPGQRTAQPRARHARLLRQRPDSGCLVRLRAVIRCSGRGLTAMTARTDCRRDP
jgi:protein-disulfide isomerase